VTLALGKEARFAECPTQHSAKNLTWDPLTDSLTSADRQALGKEYILCRVY
jgi:hypothetical protein